LSYVELAAAEEEEGYGSEFIGRHGGECYEKNLEWYGR